MAEVRMVKMIEKTFSAKQGRSHSNNSSVGATCFGLKPHNPAPSPSHTAGIMGQWAKRREAKLARKAQREHKENIEPSGEARPQRHGTPYPLPIHARLRGGQPKQLDSAPANVSVRENTLPSTPVLTRNTRERSLICYERFEASHVTSIWPASPAVVMKTTVKGGRTTTVAQCHGAQGHTATSRRSDSLLGESDSLVVDTSCTGNDDGEKYTRDTLYDETCTKYTQVASYTASTTDTTIASHYDSKICTQAASHYDSTICTQSASHYDSLICTQDSSHYNGTICTQAASLYDSTICTQDSSHYDGTICYQVASDSDTTHNNSVASEVLVKNIVRHNAQPVPVRRGACGGSPVPDTKTGVDDISEISLDGSRTDLREQEPSTSDLTGGVLHSTLSYPLSSTKNRTCMDSFDISELVEESSAFLSSSCYTENDSEVVPPLNQHPPMMIRRPAGNRFAHLNNMEMSFQAKVPFSSTMMPGPQRIFPTGSVLSDFYETDLETDENHNDVPTKTLIGVPPTTSSTTHVSTFNGKHIEQHSAFPSNVKRSRRRDAGVWDNISMLPASKLLRNAKSPTFCLSNSFASQQTSDVSRDASTLAVKESDVNTLDNNSTLTLPRQSRKCRRSLARESPERSIDVDATMKNEGEEVGNSPAITLVDKSAQETAQPITRRQYRQAANTRPCRSASQKAARGCRHRINRDRQRDPSAGSELVSKIKTRRYKRAVGKKLRSIHEHMHFRNNRIGSTFTILAHL